MPATSAGAGLAKAFTDESFLTYSEPELSPRSYGYGYGYGSPFGDVFERADRLTEMLRAGADGGDTTSSSPSSSSGSEASGETAVEEPHWVFTEIGSDSSGTGSGSGSGSGSGASSSSSSSSSAGSGTTGDDGYDMQADLERMFRENGIHARVSSGKRPPGKAGKAGSRSRHVHGRACDIVPQDGYTFEDIRREMAACDPLLAYMKEHDYGVIDETPEEVLKKTGGTGPHWHVGDDSGADRNFFVAARRGGRLDRGLEYMRMLRKYGQ